MRLKKYLPSWIGASADVEQKDLGRHALILNLSAAATLLLAFLQSIIVTRYLGAHSFGLIVVVVAFVTIVNQIADFRAWELISNHAAASLAVGRSTDVLAFVKLSCVVAFGSGAVATLVCLTAGPYFSAAFWHQPTVVPFVIGYGIAAPLSGQSQNVYAVLRIVNRYRTLALLRVATAGFSILLVIVVTVADLGLRGMYAAYVLGALVPALAAVCVGLVVLRREIGDGLLRADWRTLDAPRELRAYLGRSWVTGSLSVVAIQADEFVLSIFALPETVAMYRVTKNFGRLALSFSDPVSEVIFPQAARLWARQVLPAIGRLVAFIVKAGVAFVIGVLVLSVWWMPAVIARLYGADFRPSRLLVVLIMMNALYIPFLWCGPVFRVAGRIRTAVRLEVVTAVLTALTLVVLTPRYGAYGAAIGFSAHSVIYSVIAAVYFWRRRQVFFGSPEVA